MSTNCIQCVKNKRTGPDLLCDDCRRENTRHTPTPPSNDFRKEGDVAMPAPDITDKDPTDPRWKQCPEQPVSSVGATPTPPSPEIEKVALKCAYDVSGLILEARIRVIKDAITESTAALQKEIEELRKVLRKLHDKCSEPCCVFFEGERQEISTDLGEAYQDSQLCEEVSRCLAIDSARKEKV